MGLPFLGRRCFALRGGIFGLVCGIGGGVTSLSARSRGEPSSAHCEQRLSERLTPCPCDPVCACTGMRGHARKGKNGYRQTRKQTKGWKRDVARSKKQPAFLPAPPHAAQRAVPGWRGGLGRVGADLASAGSMRPPPSPARTVSTAWLAPQTPGKKRQRETPPHQPANKPTAKSSCLVTLFHSEFKHS